MRTYSINGVDLDDTEGRWRLEASTLSPTPSGQEIATITTPGVHGARLTGKRQRNPATLVLSIAVFGKTHANLRENFQELLNTLASWHTNGLLTIEYDDGEIITTNTGVISSDLTPTERGERTLILPITLTLPDPFWTETTTETLHLTPDNQPQLWGALAGGSAPVFPTVHVRGASPVTGVRVECVTSGRVATWSGSASELWWSGWQVRRSADGQADKGLGFGVEAEPVLYPDGEGEYRVRVEVSGGGSAPVVELFGSRRFQ